MPYVKLSLKNSPRADPLRGILLERMKALNMTQRDVAEKMGISLSTYQRLMKQHSDKWTLEELTLALRSVNVRLTTRTNYEELFKANE